MNNMCIGIETSCDDTSISLVSRRKERTIIHNLQTNNHHSKHKANGGVIPSLASQCHSDVLNQMFVTHNFSMYQKNISCVAVTRGPGLACSLIIGTIFARALAISWNKPIFGINHLEGHIFSSFIGKNNIEYPFLTLLFSGGHSQIVLTKNLNKHTILCQTLDDAVGECFDKVARMLGMEYPGGVHIEQRARYGNEDKIHFPRSMCTKKNLKSMSFSGIKTSVQRYVDKNNVLSEEEINDICASFQKTIKDILVYKLDHILQSMKEEISCVSFCGGVSANRYLCHHIYDLCNKYAVQFISPPLELCGDNAAMIAMLGAMNFEKKNKKNLFKHHDTIQPNWCVSSL